MRFAAFLFMLLSIVALSFPATPLGTVSSGLSEFCTNLTGLLPAVSMLMVLVGAVVYATGQISGAETRARANVWATAALTGALVSVLIVSISQPLLTLIYGEGEVSCSLSTGTSGPSGPQPRGPGWQCSQQSDCNSGYCNFYINPSVCL